MKYFGYAGIDCGGHNRNNYTHEISSFSNLAQMAVYYPKDNIVLRLLLMNKYNVKAMLCVQLILFEGVEDSAYAGGMKFTLYPQYEERWDTFVNYSNGLNNPELQACIAAFYIADEPLWNGISYEDLKTASNLVKETFPGIPVAFVEAHTMLHSIQVPESIDWVGIDHYAIPSPDTNEEFLNELVLLKSKLSTNTQKILLVMDAQWLPFYGKSGYTEEYMATVATSYFNIFQNNIDDIVGIMCYTWAGGVDCPEQKGTRDLPNVVLNEHIRIGKIITGKGYERS